MAWMKSGRGLRIRRRLRKKREMLCNRVDFLGTQTHSNMKIKSWQKIFDKKPSAAKNKHHRRRQQQIFIFSYEFVKINICFRGKMREISINDKSGSKR